MSKKAKKEVKPIEPSINMDARNEYDDSGSRRKKAEFSSGCINFPAEGGEYHNDATGGMYVQLVAIEKRSTIENWWEDMFVVCWGGGNTSLEYQEGMAGTDTLKDEWVPYYPQLDAEWEEMVADKAFATKYFFPNFYDKSKPRNERERSVPVLASTVLGSSGGTWCKGERDYFRCTYNDLTDEGKVLYDSFKKLYGEKAELHLITWMDEG